MEELTSFIKWYQSLTEKEKFQAGNEFLKATGGKLSPYNSPDVVCVGLIKTLNELGEMCFVGVRRAIPPCVGEIALPGGFLNPQEDPVSGTKREILEETGIDINHLSLKAIDAKMGHNNHTLLFFITEECLPYSVIKNANENLKRADGEASELVFINQNTPLCFPLHKDAVNNAFEANHTQLIKPFKF